MIMYWVLLDMGPIIKTYHMFFVKRDEAVICSVLQRIRQSLFRFQSLG